jgi:hypothetical protein
MNKKRKVEQEVEEPEEYIIKSAKNLKNKYIDMYTPNTNTNNINSYFNPYYTSEYSQMNMFNTMQQQYMYNPMMQTNPLMQQSQQNPMMPQNQQSFNPMMPQNQQPFNPFIQPMNPFIHPTQNNNMNKK